MLPFINAPFAYASSILGSSVDELKLIFSFLLSYPLAGVLKRIPDNKPYLKNVFIIGAALFYLVGLFDLWSGTRTILISASGAYAISYYLDGPSMPWIGFVFLMGHMSVNHIYRHIANDPSSVDITGAQMVLVMKLTAFCWNVHDGRLPEKSLEDWQKERALKQLPGFLDYAAFVLFFPSLLVGPAFDYADYQRWIDATMFDLPPGVDPAKAPLTRKKRKIPRSGTPAMWKAATGLVWIFAFLQFSGHYYPEALLSEEYLKYGLLRRVWNLHMVGFTVRMKYYGAWFLAEGACIQSGIGYKGVDPKTGRVDWSKLQNINPLGIELAQNSRAYLGNWNINTNNWLRNYVYLRVTPKGKKPGFRASMATFVTSAFWHGFEPGYYMAFVLGSFIQNIAKNCRRHLRPFFMTSDGKRETQYKRYYDVASWLLTQLAFSFAVAPFILLSFDASFELWARVRFYCIIGVVFFLALFSPPGKAMFKKSLNARMQKPAMLRTESTDSVQHMALGMPDDIGKDFDEIIAEVTQEIESRQQNGTNITDGLQEAVRKRMKEAQKKAD